MNILPNKKVIVTIYVAFATIRVDVNASDLISFLPLCPARNVRNKNSKAAGNVIEVNMFITYITMLPIRDRSDASFPISKRNVTFN